MAKKEEKGVEPIEESSEKPKTRKCKSCGSVLPVDNKICYNCGTKKKKS